jgi:iron complex outermembrane receptor protein
VFNASISYETNQYRVDLKVDNLTDETYYKGWTTINPQAPRTVKANVTYKF